jgi:hypothetical protein
MNRLLFQYKSTPWPIAPYATPSIVKFKKNQSWHVERMGECKGAYRVLAGKPERKGKQDLGVGGRIILKWIINK